VIEARAEAVEARLLLEDRDWGLEQRMPGVGGQALTVRGLHATYDDVPLPLFGEFAGLNASAAVAAVEALLGHALEEHALREALVGATSPGRLEVVARRPLVLLDGAHNPDAASALAEALGESFTWERLHLVIAVFANKDLEGIADALAPLADAAYTATTDSARARPSEEIEAALTSRGLQHSRSRASMRSKAATSAAEAGTSSW
jgi:dihydrofolate synthase/folylpolyglutamate synthase